MTEAERIDEELRDEIGRHYIEDTPDAVVIVGLDGRILLVNDNALKMFGYPKAEMLGQAVEMLVPTRSIARHREDRSRYQRRPVRRMMGKGAQLRGHHKDGEEFDVVIALTPKVSKKFGPLTIASLRYPRLEKEEEANEH